jgi:hypothetical protein
MMCCVSCFFVFLTLFQALFFAVSKQKLKKPSSILCDAFIHFLRCVPVQQG